MDSSRTNDPSLEEPKSTVETSHQKACSPNRSQDQLDAVAHDSDQDGPNARLYDLNFLLAFASQSIFVVANTLLAHYARWIEFLGGNLTQIGWIMGFAAFAGLVFRPWLAQLINRLGARTTWLIGYLMFSLASFGNIALHEIGPLIYLFRSASVLGTAIVFSSSLTYISQIAPDRRRTEAIGILGVGGFLGMLFGPLLGDLLLGVGERDRADFLTMFCVAGYANVVPALMLMMLRKPEHHGVKESLGIRQFFVRVREYWPGNILLVAFTFGCCMTVPFGFLASYIDELPLRLNGISEIGFFFWCYAGCGIVFRVGLRNLPDQIGPESVLLLGTFFTAVGMIAFCFVTTKQSFFIAIPACLTGVGHGMMFHTMSSLAIAPFPKSLRGTASALTLMTLDLGMFLGAPILGLIGNSFGYVALYATLATVLCLSGSIFYFTECKTRSIFSG